MITSEKQRRHRATGIGWRKTVCSAAFCLLLFHALMGAPSATAESTYHLVGTVESKGFTGAVILTPDGMQSFYRLRETLPDGAELVRVYSNSILLKGSDGARYEMFITAAGKLQTATAPGVSALAQPQAQSPVDNDQQKRSARRRSQRSSSSEE